MDGRVEILRKKLDRALREAAEAAVALDRAEGTIQGVPHYSVIELLAHQRGRQLSQRIQERQMAEIAALETPKAKCPSCGERSELVPKKRRLNSMDGSVELQELEGYCPFCRRSFFPDEGSPRT